MLRTHLAAMVAYSLLVGVLFSLFMREGVAERVRFAALLALSMIGVALAAGWLMYAAS